jgi:hypothetical protein
VDEAGWQGCTQLFEMLPLVERRLSDRKRRLFAVACCRRFAHLFGDVRSLHALEVAERYADGLASEEEREAAEDAAVDVHIMMRESRFSPSAVRWSRQAELLTQAAVLAVSPGVYYAGDAADYGRLALAASGAGRWVDQEEEARQCRLLRDVAGPPPFADHVIDPGWLAGNDRAAEQVARWLYETKTFADLPILGDALEEAGCTDQRILDHCRLPGEHVRGCWVVDLILEKQ